MVRQAGRPFALLAQRHDDMPQARWIQALQQPHQCALGAAAGQRVHDVDDGRDLIPNRWVMDDLHQNFPKLSYRSIG